MGFKLGIGGETPPARYKIHIFLKIYFLKHEWFDLNFIKYFLIYKILIKFIFFIIYNKSFNKKFDSEK